MVVFAGRLPGFPFTSPGPSPCSSPLGFSRSTAAVRPSHAFIPTPMPSLTPDSHGPQPVPSSLSLPLSSLLALSCVG
ncbi:hypothetical protein LX36DRAFT_652492, partial [Colletotrichum falcatum]